MNNIWENKINLVVFVACCLGVGALIILLFIGRIKMALTIDIISLGAIAVGIYSVWRIGKKQNEISGKIKEIEDSVELFVYSQNLYEKGRVIPNVWMLYLTNVGKLQVYILSHEINGVTTKIDRGLIPANQGQNAWFNLLLKSNEPTGEMQVIVEDQLGRKWISRISFKMKDYNSLQVTTHKIARVEDNSQ